MFIGHLPVGYLISKCLARRLRATGVEERRLVAAGLLGAVVPDVDLLYFYLIDERQHHHHLYFPHLPVVWLALTGVSAAWVFAPRSRAIALLVFIFSLNGLAHMLLDSVAADIWWFGPWVDMPLSLVTVPVRFEPWWLNFLLHWTFLLEVLVLLLAVYVWHRTRQTERARTIDELSVAAAARRVERSSPAESGTRRRGGGRVT